MNTNCEKDDLINMDYRDHDFTFENFERLDVACICKHFNNNVKTYTVNDKYLYDKQTNKGLTAKIFNENDTIIIQSATGTGKTSTICSHLKKIEGLTCISLVAKRELAKQHHKDMSKYLGSEK